MDDLKVAIPERGEVLIEWGDRKEVVSLAPETARKLDLALPNKAPGESGILSTLYMDLSQYPIETCRVIIKAAFACCTIPFSDTDMAALEEEAGFGDVGMMAVNLLRPVVMGKKKWLAFLARVAEQMPTIAPENSPGPNGSELPSESST